MGLHNEPMRTMNLIQDLLLVAIPVIRQPMISLPRPHRVARQPEPEVKQAFPSRVTRSISQSDQRLPGVLEASEEFFETVFHVHWVEAPTLEESPVGNLLVDVWNPMTRRNPWFPRKT